MLGYLYDLYKTTSAWFTSSETQRETATDLVEVVIDCSKHKHPDGSYQLVIYEVQGIRDSVLVPSSQISEFITEMRHRDFFTRLFGRFTYFVYLDRHAMSVGTTDVPDFSMRGRTFPLFLSKITQRLYFNTHPVLRETMPEVMIVSSDDVNCRLDQIYEAVSNHAVVIKRDNASNGKGNIFLPAHTSKKALKTALLKTYRESEDRPTRDFLLIEIQTSAEQNPRKNHTDVYRAACVKSTQKGFFNAQIITRYASEKGVADSHAFIVRDSYAAEMPLTTVHTPEGQVLSAVPDMAPEAERNTNLQKHKPALFEKFRAITQAIGEFNSESLYPYMGQPPEKLVMDKVRFFSAQTCTDVIQATQLHYASRVEAKPRGPQP